MDQPLGRQGSGYHPDRTAKRKKGFLKSKGSLRELWDIKYTNLITRVLGGEERHREGKDILKK